MDGSLYIVENKGNITILTLTLDAVTMEDNEELKRAFSKFLDSGAKNIILDLSRTGFISSLVIASLVYMWKRAKEAGGNLVLCNVTKKVREVLEITNLDKVFDIFDDRAQAIAKLEKA